MLQVDIANKDDYLTLETFQFQMFIIFVSKMKISFNVVLSLVHKNKCTDSTYI